MSKSLDSTIWISTILWFNSLEFNDLCVQQFWRQWSLWCRIIGNRMPLSWCWHNALPSRLIGCLDHDSAWPRGRAKWEKKRVGEKYKWLKQCGTNIWIFEYIRIYLDKYIHLSKYSSIFSKANIFGYSFVIYFCWQICWDIHSSSIYDSEYIWIFIVSQNWLNFSIIGPKWFNMGTK